jgi:processive 1,2-diacylglycerol beta-glucosyltransferase
VVQLFDNDTNQLVGTITDEQLQFLADQLEEESADDTDYYITADTLDLLAQAGADAGLIHVLREALGGREGVEVHWIRS